MRHWIFLYLGCLGLLAHVSVAQDSWNVTRLSEIATWNAAYQLAVQDSFVYVASGATGLRILRYGAQNELVEIGYWDTQASTNRVVVAGNFAYLADSQGGFVVVDITNPTEPHEVARIDYYAWIRDVAVRGNRAYIAAEGSGLRIIDISDPTAPTEITSFHVDAGALGVEISGNYAYVLTGYQSGVRFINIEDEHHLYEAGFFTIWNSGAFQVAIEDTLLYIACAWSGLRIVDISDPALPEHLSDLSLGNVASDVVIRDDLAYVANGANVLRVINIADPFAPRLVETFATADSALDLDIVGDRIFVADYYGGVRVLDISDTSNIRETGMYRAIGQTYGVVKSGNLLLQSRSLDGLQIVDVSDPNVPLVLSEFATGDYVFSTFAHGARAYLMGGQTDIPVIDFSDPHNLHQMGIIETEWSVRRMVRSDSLLCFGDGSLLRIVEASELSDPQEVGSFVMQRSASDLVINGSTIYISHFNLGIAIVDISVPELPVALGELLLNREVYALAVSENTLYVANGEWGVAIINIADPHNPEQIGTIYTMGTVVDVEISGTLLIIADQDFGLLVTDISNRDLPVDVGLHEASGRTYGLAADGNIVYLADDYYLGIYDISAALSTSPSRKVTISNYSLSSIYPNPFNSSATITLDLPNQLRGRLVAYDALGREVRTLIDGTMRAGSHDVRFDANGLSSGNYFVLFESPQFSAVQKAVLVK